MRKYTTIFYCTHILDDVQRVSDTVAILNHGELVTYGSIESLLAGSEGIAYEVHLKGDSQDLHHIVCAQPWVSGVQVKMQNGVTEWIINVSEAGAAEASLFRLLSSDEKVIVMDYHRKEHELEEVFLRIIEGENHGNRK